MERSSLEKRVSSITDKLGGAVIEKIDKKAAAELKAKKEEALRKKKERDAKFKEINKNFARKDKRDTHRFLIKHGLTPEEAKRYTQLGSELQMENLSIDDKKMLEGNFSA